MAIVRAKNPLRWVRRALLILGLAGIAGVTVLLAAYRFGNAGRVDREEVPEPSANIDERTVTAGEGFDYTQTSEGNRVFRIRAAKSRQDRADWAFLEEVHLEIYREDGQTTSVTSRRARVNQQTWAAELEGDVVMQGWENLELRARGLELLDGGQQLISVGAVEFHYPPPGQTVDGGELALPALTGRASSLRIDRRTDTINLSGGVHIRNVPGAEIPLRVDCERLVYRRDEGLVRAFEDIFLQYGAQELQARALTLFMNDPAESAGEAGAGEPEAVTGERPEGRGLRMLRARWDVRGRLAATGSLGQSGLPGAGGVEFEGQFLEVEPKADDSSFQHMRLEGDDAAPASVKVVDETGLAQRLTAGLLEAYAVDDRLQVVEGVGMPLLLEEYLDLDQPYYLRQACARRGRARFLADGRLGRIDLEQQVELRDGALYLSGGADAGLDLEHGTLEIQGPAVELFNERGAITAPKFSYNREKGILHATDGVQALLKSTAAFAETPLGRGDEPVRIEAAEATWTETPPTFAFRGGVRAWQGQNLLLADQLRGDEDKQELAASGGVSTVWIAETTAGGKPPSTAGADPPAASNAPIEIQSRHLTYVPSAASSSTDARTLIYSGEVRVKQGRRTIQCRELTVELAAAPDSPGATAAAGKPQRLICREDVLLTDPIANREVRGDLAIYGVAQRQVEIFGESVRLLDEQRNTLVGKYLVYDLAAGTVRLRSRPPDGGGEGRSQAPRVGSSRPPRPEKEATWSR